MCALQAEAGADEDALEEEAMCATLKDLCMRLVVEAPAESFGGGGVGKAVSPRPTAAVPMGNPYRSCKL